MVLGRLKLGSALSLDVDRFFLLFLIDGDIDSLDDDNDDTKFEPSFEISYLEIRFEVILFLLE